MSDPEFVVFESPLGEGPIAPALAAEPDPAWLERLLKEAERQAAWQWSIHQALAEREKGEIREFLVNLDENKAFDPNLNICAGIRWLFHKKKLLEGKLKRPATWEEAAMEYKSYTAGLLKGDRGAIQQRDKFLNRYGKLKLGRE